MWSGLMTNCSWTSRMVHLRRLRFQRVVVVQPLSLIHLSAQFLILDLTSVWLPAVKHSCSPTVDGGTRASHGLQRAFQLRTGNILLVRRMLEELESQK